MPEQEQKVETVSINYICDECKVGELKPTGKVFFTHPPKYEHQCNNCIAKQTFSVSYPRLEHRIVTNS